MSKKTCTIKPTTAGRFMVLAGSSHHSFGTRAAAETWAKDNKYRVIR